MKKEKLFFKFSPEDLCVSRGGKILLLDKNINWNRQFGLVSGEEYLLEDPIIRELEKCRIITGGAFINTGYFPVEVEVYGGPHFYIENKIQYQVNLVKKYKEFQISSERENLEFPCDGDMSKNEKEWLELLPQKNQEEIFSFRSYIEWTKKENLTIFEVASDFEKKVGYRLHSSEDFINPQVISHDYKKEPRLLKSRKFLYEEIFIDGSHGEIKEKVESLEYVKLSESGFNFSFNPVRICPTGQIGKLKIGDYEHPDLICWPGDGTGSYLDFVEANNRLDNPPSTLDEQDVEFLKNGGRVAFSYYSWEYSYGGFDGTDNIWDCFPAGYIRQNETPENPKGWISLHYTCRGHAYIFDPNFSNEGYIRKIEEAHTRTLAFEKFKASGKYSTYSHNAITGTYFLVEEVNPKTDLLYNYGWDYGYLSQSSFNRSQGIRFFEGVENGFYIKKDLEEAVNEFKFIIPMDGSGIYLRIPKDHELHEKVRFAGLIKRTVEKLNEAYPMMGMFSGWDNKIFNALVRDVEKSDFNEVDIDAFEEKVLNLYQIQKNLISNLRVSLEEILKNTFVEFVSEEISEIYKSINISFEGIEVPSFENLQKKFSDVNGKISKLSGISKDRKSIHDIECIQKRSLLVNQAKEMGVGEHLLDIFGGDLVRASQFMSNVAKIETWRLDENEITCGRSRASQNINDAWGAMGETDDFFCGSDPNDVKYYVCERHFGEESTPVVRREEKGNYNKNLSTSNNPMEEALRRAGLI